MNNWVGYGDRANRMHTCSDIINFTIHRVIKVMVEKYPDCLQYRDSNNCTVFLTACEHGHAHLVEYLITEHDADFQGNQVYDLL